MSNTICIFNEQRSGDLICTDFVYETSAIQESTVQKDCYILGVVEGSDGLLLTEGEERGLFRGDIFIIPPNVPYRLRFSADIAYYYIAFYGRRAEELVSRVSRSRAAAVFGSREDYSDLLPFCRECIEKARRKNRDIFGEAALLYILAHIGEEAKPSEALLSRMIEITHNSYTSAAFSLDSLAKTLFYDSKYLSHYFKRQKGIGYSNYLRALRLDHAVFLMEQGLSSVKNVSLLSGFTDSLYFSKIFKKEKGVSPKEYIASIGNSEANTQ